MSITPHPDYELIDILTRRGDKASKQAVELILELKKALRRERDRLSRLQFPDTSGQ